MGKASRWLANFLLGKKEDKRRKQLSISFEEGGETTPSATPFNRRWSFGKLGSKERAHKSSRSLDSMTAAPLVKQAVLGLKNRHDNTTVLAMAMASTAGKRKTKATYSASLISKAVEDAAATRIQAAFRSYLARKALRALRGLVKLQALVRGHLVRKQTTDTLRRMHALMAIQVRARFQRIQMAEEPQLATKSQSSRYGRFSQEMGFMRAQREAVDIDLYEKRGIIKRQNGFMNNSNIERIEQGITRFYSGELPISKKEHNYEEFSFTAHNSPRHSPPMSKLTPRRSSFSSHESPYMPNYMANTQSSMAKVRSQSEPKQRPTLNFQTKGKRTASVEEMNDNTPQQSSSQSKGVTGYSEYRKSLVTNEVIQEFTVVDLKSVSWFFFEVTLSNIFLIDILTAALCNFVLTED
ncbi:hypothetical protein PTKIN_Ptkin01aG0337400 [Pterospermum kingtungense]